MIRAAEATRHAVIVAFWAVLTPRQILFLQTLRSEGWRITVLAWDREDSGKGPDLPEGLVAEVRLVSVRGPTWSITSKIFPVMCQIQISKPFTAICCFPSADLIRQSSTFQPYMPGSQIRY